MLVAKVGTGRKERRLCTFARQKENDGFLAEAFMRKPQSFSTLEGKTCI